MNTQTENYKLVLNFADKASRDSFLSEMTLKSHPCHYVVECISTTCLEVFLCDGGYSRVFDLEKKRLDELYRKITAQ